MILRSLWVQGYTDVYLVSSGYFNAFPVGTGIYRIYLCIGSICNSVPCGYRDIPSFCDFSSIFLTRSLWVQGYTVFLLTHVQLSHAFPVGTGIYRQKID